MSEIPGWWSFVYVDSKEEYDEHPGRGWWDDYWPTDVTSDGYYSASIDSYQVFYYDERGRKYKVNRKDDEA